jgi:cell division protease FtsH
MIPEADPVHKVTIIARGNTLGVTWFLPEDDQRLTSEADFKAHLAVGLGGRVAEELIYGDITTGARGDLESITRMARDMVTRYGMSKKLGPLTYGDRDELIFLGRQLSEQRNYSDETAEYIDLEVRGLIEEGHQRASQILTDNLDKLKLLAQNLLEHETLDADEFIALLRGDESVTPPESAPRGDVSPPKSSPAADIPPGVLPPSTAPLPA